jgi:hypothetical protein
MGGGVVEGVRDWSKRSGGNRATPAGGGVKWGEGGTPKAAAAAPAAAGGAGLVIGGR